jgi:hypothetical protein
MLSRGRGSGLCPFRDAMHRSASELGGGPPSPPSTPSAPSASSHDPSTLLELPKHPPRENQHSELDPWNFAHVDAYQRGACPGAEPTGAPPPPPPPPLPSPHPQSPPSEAPMTTTSNCAAGLQQRPPVVSKGQDTVSNFCLAPACVEPWRGCCPATPPPPSHSRDRNSLAQPSVLRTRLTSLVYPGIRGRPHDACRMPAVAYHSSSPSATALPGHIPRAHTANQRTRPRSHVIAVDHAPRASVTRGWAWVILVDASMRRRRSVVSPLLPSLHYHLASAGGT